MKFRKARVFKDAINFVDFENTDTEFLINYRETVEKKWLDTVAGIEAMSENGTNYSWRPYIGWITPEGRISRILEKSIDNITTSDLVGLHAIHLGSPSLEQPKGRCLITDAELEGDFVLVKLDDGNDEDWISLSEVNVCANKIMFELYQDYDSLGSSDGTKYILAKDYMDVRDMNDDIPVRHMDKRIQDIIKNTYGNFYEDRNSKIRFVAADAISLFLGTVKLDNVFSPRLMLTKTDFLNQAIKIVSYQESQKIAKNMSELKL